MQQNQSFLTWYRAYAQDALLNNERRLVLLSGQESWALSLLTSIDLVSKTLKENSEADSGGSQQLGTDIVSPCLIFGDSSFFASNILKNRFRDKLGSESEVIIFADSQFTVDAFAALSGTLIAGGVCFLVIPSLDEKLAQSQFLTRFCALIDAKSPHTIISQPTGNESQKHSPQNYFVSAPLRCITSKMTDIKKVNLDVTSAVFEPVNTELSCFIRNSCVTDEQYTAVQAIIKVVSGHRKRPLILTADRGRGKSSALAIACAQLMKVNENNDFNIVITAPDIQALSIFFEQLSVSLVKSERIGNCITYGKSRLTFAAIDQLIKQPLACNLLMVDEAAGIPVYILESLLELYHRMVFSSTVHGYEGAGRGFTLKFKKILNRLCPQWNSLHIKQPIRWRDNDPLENLVFEACLLNAELPKLSCISTLVSMPDTRSNQANISGIKAETKKLDFKIITAEELITNEGLLKQVFAVLVTAHYQTKPSDLKLLLDNPQVQIVCLISSINNKQEVVAVALLMKEGAAVHVSSKDVSAIKQSKRRLRDHFIPQSLLTHCGFESAFSYSYLRVLRIAVHPELHQVGIGSYFMQRIEQYSKAQKYDFIGSSFGANAELLAFWLKAGFSMARVGFTKDKASGEHSALVIKGLKEHGIACQFSSEFFRTFDYLLLDEYKSLDTALTHLILKHNVKNNLLVMSTLDIANVKAYANGERLFSACAYSLYLWFKHELLISKDSITGYTEKETVERKSCQQELLKARNKSNMAFVLIARLIQKHDINTVCKQYGFTGKKQLNQAIKDYINLRLKESDK